MGCGRLSLALHGFPLLIPVSFGCAMASKWMDSPTNAIASSEVPIDAKSKSKLAGKIGAFRFQLCLPCWPRRHWARQRRAEPANPLGIQRPSIALCSAIGPLSTANMTSDMCLRSRLLWGSPQLISPSMQALNG